MGDSHRDSYERGHEYSYEHAALDVADDEE